MLTSKTIRAAAALIITVCLSFQFRAQTLTITQATPVACFGQANAVLTASASGGTGPYTYTWVPSGSNSATLSNVGAGSYTCMATDAASVSFSATFIVTQPPALSITAVASNSLVCSGSTVTLTASGASTYTWSNGMANGGTINPTITAGYTVAGTSSAGCTATAVTNVAVEYTPSVSGDASKNPLCLGQTTALFGNGATSYTWSSPVINGATFTPTVTATYTVTGSNSCGTASNVITLTVNPLPVITASASSSAVCIGNSVTLTGGGGTTYTWTGGVLNNVAFPPTVSATYTVTGSDANHCSNTAVKSITVNALPTVSASASSTVVCNGNTVIVNGAGASTYTWTGTITNNLAFTPTVTTTYTVTGTDVNGCQNTAVQTISVNPLPLVGANASTVICFGGSASLNAGGANTYTWSNGLANGSIVSPTITTTYTVAGTSTLTGCTSTNIASKTVTVNALPTVTASASSTVVCSGNSVTLNGSGANTYTWTSGITNGQAFAITATTGYSVTGTNTLTGCTSTNVAAVTVSVNALPTVSAVASASVVCAGTQITLNGANANTYTWSPNISNGVAFTPTGTVTYTVTGTSTLTGCTNTATQAITVNALPSVQAFASNTAICNGAAVVLSGLGASTFTWSNGVTDGTPFTPSVTATYSVTGTNALTGCSNSTTQVIIVNALPTISVIATNTAICIGNTVALIATGANTYTWTGGVLNGITFTPTATASYNVMGTNTLSGCTNTNNAFMTIVVNPLPVITLQATQTLVCMGQTITLSAFGAHTFNWSGGITNATAFTPTSTNTYSVTGTNTLTGCTSTNNASQLITVNSLPVVTALAARPVICNGETASLTAAGAVSYTWNTGDNGASITTMSSITYTYSVVGTGTNGCKSSATVVQAVDACNGLTANEKEAKQTLLIFPNPSNGQFTLLAGSEITLTVVNELGQQIMKISLTEDTDHKATVNGLAKGVYFVMGQGSNGAVRQKIVVTD